MTVHDTRCSECHGPDPVAPTDSLIASCCIRSFHLTCVGKRLLICRGEIPATGSQIPCAAVGHRCSKRTKRILSIECKRLKAIEKSLTALQQSTSVLKITSTSATARNASIPLEVRHGATVMCESEPLPVSSDSFFQAVAPPALENSAIPCSAGATDPSTSHAGGDLPGSKSAELPDLKDTVTDCIDLSSLQEDAIEDASHELPAASTTPEECAETRASSEPLKPVGYWEGSSVYPVSLQRSKWSLFELERMIEFANVSAQRSNTTWRIGTNSPTFPSQGKAYEEACDFIFAYRTSSRPAAVHPKSLDLFAIYPEWNTHELQQLNHAIKMSGILRTSSLRGDWGQVGNLMEPKMLWKHCMRRVAEEIAEKEGDPAVAAESEAELSQPRAPTQDLVQTSRRRRGPFSRPDTPQNSSTVNHKRRRSPKHSCEGVQASAAAGASGTESPPSSASSSSSSNASPRNQIPASSRKQSIPTVESTSVTRSSSQDSTDASKSSSAAADGFSPTPARGLIPAAESSPATRLYDSEDEDCGSPAAHAAAREVVAKRRKTAHNVELLARFDAKSATLPALQTKRNNIFAHASLAPSNRSRDGANVQITHLLPNSTVVLGGFIQPVATSTMTPVGCSRALAAVIATMQEIIDTSIDLHRIFTSAALFYKKISNWSVDESSTIDGASDGAVKSQCLSQFVRFFDAQHTALLVIHADGEEASKRTEEMLAGWKQLTRL